MAQRDRFQRCERRLAARQRLKFFRFKRPFDRAQPVRPLRMTQWREMFEKSRMAD